jgi:tight adherence protein B
VLIAVMLAVAIFAGAPWQAVAAVALAVLHPVWFLVGVALWAVVRYRRAEGPTPDDEAVFLRGLAAELSAGASLRGAVVAAAGRAPALDLGRAARLCAAGRPAAEIGIALEDSMGVNQEAVAAAFRLAARTGGAIAPVVEALAERAEADGRLGRERRALTAQARMSAWVVGGAPVGLIVLGSLTGAGPDIDELGAGGSILVVAGLALIVGGSLLVWAMVRSAER